MNTITIPIDTHTITVRNWIVETGWDATGTIRSWLHSADLELDGKRIPFERCEDYVALSDVEDAVFEEMQK